MGLLPFQIKTLHEVVFFFVGIPYCLAGMMGFPQDFWTGFAVIDVSYLIEGPRGDGGILSSRSHAPIATTSEPCSRWPNVAQMGHKWRVSWMVELYPWPCATVFHRFQVMAAHNEHQSLGHQFIEGFWDQLKVDQLPSGLRCIIFFRWKQARMIYIH